MDRELTKEKTPIAASKTRKGEKRLEVLKTYKLYIGGQFPRTESGRYYAVHNARGEMLGNISLSSRKDFREAVLSARNAFGGWSSRAVFNRGQILYRMAEMLESRKAQFVEELVKQDSSKTNARKEVTASVERLVYYAGWCDKYQQIFSSVNPVASSHFNFSVAEPTGVVAVIASPESSLISLVSLIAPVIAGGNTCVVLASETKPLCSMSFAEVLNSSDLPAGVVNILTGKLAELFAQFASHMDVNAIIYAGSDDHIRKEIQKKASGNVKRVLTYTHLDWMAKENQSPYFILSTQEIKTTWHPIEPGSGGGGKY